MNNFKVVLDSCILIYLCDPKTKKSSISLINELLAKGIEISYSSFSAFEVLKNRQEKENSEEYTNLMNQLFRIPIDSPVLMNASTLYFLYKKSGKISWKNEVDGELIDSKDKLTGDLIIGGTVLSYEHHVLLTANRKDFPEPYWKIYSEHEVISESSIKIKLFLLVPDVKIIEKILKKEIQNTKVWSVHTKSYDYRG